MPILRSKTIRFSSVLLFAASPLSVANLAVAEPSFTGMGTDNTQAAYTASISDDGTTIVGNRITDTGFLENYKWTETSGFTALACSPNSNDGYVHDTSADGSITVGTCFFSVDSTIWDTTAVAWGPDSNLPTPLWIGNARHVSSDGQYVIGDLPNRSVAYTSIMRWNAATNTQDTLLTRAQFKAASDDGNIIIGLSEGYDVNGSPLDGIFRWENGTTTTLPLTNGVDPYSSFLLSGDGSVIYAGEPFASSSFPSYRWTQATGWTDITDATWAVGIKDTNFDGSIAVGEGLNKNDGTKTAIIWDTTNGVRLMSDVIREWGLLTSDWDLGVVTSVSADGTAFTGTGYNSNTAAGEGWHARLSGTPVILPNEAPTAADDYISLSEDTQITFSSVLDNDSDPENDPLTAILKSQPVNGLLSFASDGSFTYTPSQDFFGGDSFDYVANDGELDSWPATVFIYVNPTEDAPEADSGGPYSAVVKESITFNGSNSSDVDSDDDLSYTWDFGDKTTGTGVKPMHAYKSAGTYTVTLTVMDRTGLTGSVTTEATITKSGTGGDTESGKLCRDGIDNDGDGFIDDADPDCAKGSKTK